MSDGLTNRPFSWSRRGDEIYITHRSRPATILRGAPAERFVTRVRALDEEDAQQLMARVTGNFKRGNERR